MTQPLFRFAPSPNGLLHLGHAYSALLNADLAKRFGGRLILRIEDIDITRCRPEYDAAIVRDLAWLGLRFEEPIRRQSQHFDDYRLLLRRLREAGLVYPCFATRKEIAQAVTAREAETGTSALRDPDGAPLYPRLCAGLDPAEAQARIEAGEPFALRLDMAKARAEAARIAPEGLAYARFDRDGNIARVPADPARWGDAVIMRKEIPTSYHLAVVHDDAAQGVTHVVRGRDLEPATDLHVLLQCLLRLPTPLYHHHDLIRDEEGEKLAKSRVSTPIAQLREEGADPAALRAMLGFEA
ncbi:tRNA glutamyl-Q(34) synthetase GluQRS [Saliniramus sp.]|uniref:tRNA glutamyl-Q(34) synthetase GluQRS n=1 Tax=Saliniramus sp. TaxID=2986772 RepID=UPI002D09C485|nr:tRNA glutamyl-Q(34) synthetase GluQRS [Saliniramus sp.]HMB09464.1 tRNA glutamyl-Q(34) synthetase GluQRS [Saliniramus sp.]